MRPDDILRGPGEDTADVGLPIDADLQALDAELGAAGIQARRMLHGRTQPTRYFSVDLRSRLVGGYAAGAAAGTAALHVLTPPSQQAGGRGSRLRPEREAGENWAPTPLAPRIARRTPTILPRARWAMFAAAALTGVLVAGALGARLDWLFAVPPAESAAPSSSPEPAVVVVTPVPTSEPDPSVAPTDPPVVTPAPTATPMASKTPKPTPKPTPRPDPTKPPIGSMDFFTKACPGGVVLDWSKPSPGVSHYHVLRKLGGDVAASYPAPGATEVETATSWSAGVTDGYDAGLDAGQPATYRAFAFDADDHVMAVSASRTVSGVGRLSLGTLGVADNGDGSITASWSNPGVLPACFTYGKLVVSEEDPEPSYLKGSQYLAVVEGAGATETWAEVPPELSGKTVWMRYQMIRTTSLGKFVVGATDVVQVTLP